LAGALNRVLHVNLIDKITVPLPDTGKSLLTGLENVMRKCQKRLLRLIPLLVCWLPCHAQSFRVDPIGLDGTGGYFTRWDSVQDRMILYRDTSIPTAPAARIFSNNGASVPLFPLKDLVDSRYIDIWNAAATPEGGVVLDTIVGYTPRNVEPSQVKAFFLTYAADGKLLRVWDTEPYHHHAVAVDHEGSIFALGDANLSEPYPLLIKYSKDGKVLREFLPSNLFPDGEKVLEVSANGESQMFVSGRDLYLWLPGHQELLNFSLDGVLLNRISLAQTLLDLANGRGFERTTVKSLASPKKEELVAQVQLWPKDPSVPVQSVIVRITLKDRIASVLPIPMHPIWLVGSTKEGKLVLLQPEKDGKAATTITW
jgi:hypothetical protein